ncbi:LOW QUALITY PROTEIN: ribosome biogenesis protein NSA1 [Lathyrus oleraceus]|uniref:LOW QUALITY PROTEIN: ribosome biogenesis protein NSA1 n=1 Tax=Pisum sativum TaxID=3888 RepID=UPI0021CFB6BB|nr:LOW QUALITY PROTEIN: ribosome biogenesis protein NSA1 [Pisum sativum]
MPRATTLECPGCPPLRALTFDTLGLIKVLESRENQGGPKVVERWGDPDASNSVNAVSIIDRKSNPLLAVARKNGRIEVLSPITGVSQATISKANDLDLQSEENNVIGLHLFAKQNLEDSRAYNLLTCTSKGNASIRSIEVPESAAESSNTNFSKTWNVCNSGNVLCCKVDGNEKFALFGGKGVEVNIWDLDNYTKIWNAKSPPKNSLGIFTPTWFTSVSYLSKDDHRKFVAGTNNHQVRLYDISAQRRPVLSFDFRETPIKALAEDIDGNTIYLGNGSGDMASVDIRTGKMLGCFTGKCSGSIRSIVRHPELPVVASCGLDGYLRLWDTKTRQLLSSVFLKQHILHVLFDSNFIVEDIPKENSLPSKEQTVKEITDGEEIEATPLKRKKSSRNKENVIDGSEKKKELRTVKNTKNPKEASRRPRKEIRARKVKFKLKGCDLDGLNTRHTPRY